LGEEGLERRRQTADGEQVQQYVYGLEANLVFYNGLSLPLLSEFLSSIEGDPDDHKQDGESRKPFTGWPRGSRPTFHAYRSGCYLMGSYPQWSADGAMSPVSGAVYECAA
jgi:hypothetical protein